MTHAERLLWLAEREGTDKVLLFPTLRRVCPSCGGDGLQENVRRQRILPCLTCQSRGWVPVDDPAATLPCAYEWRFQQLGEKGILARCRLTPHSLGTLEKGPTHNEAAVHALYEAAKAQDAEAKRM